jgi:hypothetical protein
MRRTALIRVSGRDDLARRLANVPPDQFGRAGKPEHVA